MHPQDGRSTQAHGARRNAFALPPPPDGPTWVRDDPGANTGPNRDVAVVGEPLERERGPGGLTREVETPLPSNSPHDPMILRGDLVGSHGTWKRPCLQTDHMILRVDLVDSRGTWKCPCLQTAHMTI
jgi:hypothetical protein